MPPKVSIVLPTYNGEKYIKESIESIINQTFQDWELIIVDDCSVDNTPLIIRQYVEKDKRIKCIRNEKNQKLPNSLNIGFSHASGEYLTWTSDDNFYAENAISIMVDELSNNPAISMVYTGMIYVNESNFVLKNISVMNIENLPYVNVIGACFLYKSSVRDIVGDYATDMVLVEDYDYWLRIYEKIGNIKMIDCTPYYYRRHSDSLTDKRVVEIKQQLLKLKKKHRNELLMKLKNSPKNLCKFYYDSIESGYSSPQFISEIQELMPLLKREILDYENNTKYVIFGAGNIGEKVKKTLGDRALAYIDNDRRLQGTRKDGIEILSLEKAISRFKDVPIIIALSPEHIYEVIMQINDRKIVNYSTYVNTLNIRR